MSLEHSAPDRITAVPAEMLSLNLYGAGMDNLRLETVPVPEPRPDEILCRTDAVGVCASDYKMIVQGDKHTRMRGKDLSSDPAVPGHEVSMTVVRVGEGLRDRFRPGERFTVQADIYIDGDNTAYGYKLPGAFRQWQTVGPEIYGNGYLLPVPEGLGHSQAALAEPWACVLYSYETHRPTRSVKPGGTTWIAGAGPLGIMHLEKAIADGAARVVVSDINGARLERVRSVLGPRARDKGVRLDAVDLNDAAVEDVLEPGSVDDFILAAPAASVVEQAFPFLSKGAYVNVFAGFPGRDEAWARVNLNDMHYREITLHATSGSPIEALEEALSLAAAGWMDPNNSVAAVGGMKAAWEGIDAVREGRYPGKVVIYPQLPDLPLTPVPELVPDGLWTKEAEAELLAGGLPRIPS